MINPNGVYTDFNQLAQMKQAARADDAEGRDASLRQVANQFEALFYQTMIKSMRQSVMKSDLFAETNDSLYQGLYDQQLAMNFAGQNQGGLADVMYRQLGGTETHVHPVSPVQQSLAINPFYATRVSQSSTSNELQGLNPQDYLQRLRPAADQAAAKLGVEPAVVLSVATLETGWGQHQQGNNLFGIKADSRWQGDVQLATTKEFIQGQMQQRQEPFRRYAQVDDSIQDFAQFLLQNPRYDNITKPPVTSNQFFTGLQQAGYATDPDYADKLQQVFHSIKALLPD